VHPRGHESSDVRHIYHQLSADLIGDGPESGKVDDAGIGARARHDHLGFGPVCLSPHFVHIYAAGLAIHSVVVKVVGAP
jgi:hypothetical protein